MKGLRSWHWQKVKMEKIHPATEGVHLCLILLQILYTGMVIYAPALALNQGIQHFSLHIFAFLKLTRWSTLDSGVTALSRVCLKVSHSSQ